MRLSTTQASGRDRCRSSCRSGSPSAARPNRSCGPRGSGCRSHSRSSAARPRASRPFADLYRRVWSEVGHEGEPRLAINTHAFVADSRKAADRAFAPGYLEVMNRIGRERGWPPSGRAEYDALAAPAGPLAIGSPEEVAEKIVARPGAVSAGAVPRAHQHRRRRPQGRHACDRALRHARCAARPSGYACGSCAAGRLAKGRDRVSARASRHQMSS